MQGQGAAPLVGYGATPQHLALNSEAFSAHHPRAFSRKVTSTSSRKRVKGRSPLQGQGAAPLVGYGATPQHPALNSEAFSAPPAQTSKNVIIHITKKVRGIFPLAFLICLFNEKISFSRSFKGAVKRVEDPRPLTPSQPPFLKGYCSVTF